MTSSDMAEYIKKEFPDAIGTHRVFYNKKQDINEHKIELYKNTNETLEPVRIKFSDN